MFANSIKNKINSLKCANLYFTVPRNYNMIEDSMEDLRIHVSYDVYITVTLNNK